MLRGKIAPSQTNVGLEKIIDAMDLRSAGILVGACLPELCYLWVDGVWTALRATVRLGSIILPATGSGVFRMLQAPSKKNGGYGGLSRR
ncbi:MAG: hypothetical protein JW929_12800 [Anaerolineales bacterium]|nr:hypothetical protein [Anaerolineales bacterium]